MVQKQKATREDLFKYVASLSEEQPELTYSETLLNKLFNGGKQQ